jgi:hypothetical protein
MSFGYIVTTPISIGDIQARLYPYGIMCRYQTSRDGDSIMLVHGDEQNTEEYLGAQVNYDNESIIYFWRNTWSKPDNILQAIADEYQQEIFASIPAVYGERPLYAPREDTALKDQTEDPAVIVINERLHRRIEEWLRSGGDFTEDEIQNERFHRKIEEALRQGGGDFTEDEILLARKQLYRGAMT